MGRVNTFPGLYRGGAAPRTRRFPYEIADISNFRFWKIQFPPLWMFKCTGIQISDTSFVNVFR